MKREYKLSSIVIVMLLSGLVALITNSLFTVIAGDNPIMIFVGQFLLMFLSLIFSFAICSGLIRNRMGSVGEYLNQVNYINGKIILINIIVQIVLTFIVSLVISIGGAFLFVAMVSSQPTASKFSAISIAILIAIFSILYSLLIAYSNFYLADFLVDSNKEIGIFKHIKNIFKIGKDLLAKTFVVYLKAIVIPIILVGAFLLVLRFLAPRNGMASMLLISLIFLAIMAYAVIVGAVVMARLSDLYLDYMEVNKSNYELFD